MCLVLFCRRRRLAIVISTLISVLLLGMAFNSTSCSLRASMFENFCYSSFCSLADAHLSKKFYHNCILKLEFAEVSLNLNSTNFIKGTMYLMIFLQNLSMSTCLHCLQN